jgi:hypothetical protein
MPTNWAQYPKFAEPLLANLETIIAARFLSTAVSLYGSGHGLSAFAMTERSRRIDVEYPFLAILPNRSQVAEDRDGGVRGENHTLVFEIAVGDPVAKTAVQKALRTLRTLDAILSTATRAELFATFDASLIGPDSRRVLEHSLLTMRRIERTEAEDQIYLQVAQLIFEVQLTEAITYG